MFNIILNKISNSYFFILGFSILAGIYLDVYVAPVASLSTFLLGLIFFLSALKMDLSSVFSYFKDKKMIFTVNLLMLLVFPAVIYFATSLILPAFAVAFLILAAMPSGMTDPLLSEISGGKQELALVLTVSTSLLAPFTVPFVIELFAGTAVSVSFFDMFLALAKVIFIPFFLAEIVKKFFDGRIKKIYPSFKPISILALCLLIAGIVGKQSIAIFGDLSLSEYVDYLVPLFILFLILHFVGYFAVPLKNKEDRIATTICLTYMNFTLAIYLVDKFFVDPNIVIPVVMSVLPWAILLVPFKFIIKRTH